MEMYEGSAGANSNAATIAMNGQEFSNDGLRIDTFFSPYGNHAQAFFGLYEDENGLYDGYAVGIGNYYPTNGAFSFNIVTIQEHIGQHEIAWASLSDNFDPTGSYWMTILVDEYSINAYLYSDSTHQNLIASLSTALILPADSGMVGLATDSMALFDDYTVTGTSAPVPEPATMLLLGTGLIGLAGVGRKRMFKR